MSEEEELHSVIRHVIVDYGPEHLSAPVLASRERLKDNSYWHGMKAVLCDTQALLAWYFKYCDVRALKALQEESQEFYKMSEHDRLFETFMCYLEANEQSRPVVRTLYHTASAHRAVVTLAKSGAATLGTLLTAARAPMIQGPIAQAQSQVAALAFLPILSTWAKEKNGISQKTMRAVDRYIHTVLNYVLHPDRIKQVIVDGLHKF